MNLVPIDKLTRMPAVWRLRFLQALARFGVREETLLVLLSAVIGLVAGCCVWVFEITLWAVRTFYFHALAGATQATSARLYLLPLLPAMGGLAVVGVRKAFRQKPSKLHGVSAVLFGLIRNAGQLGPIMGVESLLASSLTLGSGGSTGPEAPIAVIGSWIGSVTGRLAGISRRNLPTLVGCGAAAGISAIFNAPIAAVLFSMEVLLKDFSVSTFTPIVISAVMSTVMYQTITGEPGSGLFAMPTNGMAYHFTFSEMPNYVLLGVLAGLMSVSFTRVLFFVEHRFDHLGKVLGRWSHPMLGAGLAGVCGVAIILMFRSDPFLGGPQGQFAHDLYVPVLDAGYATVHRALDPDWYTGKALPMGGVATLTVGFLAVVCGLKLLATALTVGSGGSGGVFAPALFLGATGGGALGMILHHFNPSLSPSSYALVGMGAVLAATIQAPLMSILLLFELTRNYQVMLPIMLAAVVATVIQQLIVKGSLYTLPLTEQGIRLGSPVGLTALRRVLIDQMPLQQATVASPSDPLMQLLPQFSESEDLTVVVLDAKGQYLGLVVLDDLRTLLVAPETAQLLLLGDVLRSDVVPLCISDTLEMALDAFSRHDLPALPVVDCHNPKTARLMGLLTHGDLLRRFGLALGR